LQQHHLLSAFLIPFTTEAVSRAGSNLERMQNQKKKIVALLSDLMFTVKIQEAAKRAGLDAIFVKTSEEAIERAKEQPEVIILDLNTNSVEPLGVIEKLKGDDETRKINLLGYVSHVQADLKHAAQEKGCDIVMARSAFSQNLPLILKRYAEPASHGRR
jgi:CheY-like chemotaxis protein